MGSRDHLPGEESVSNHRLGHLGRLGRDASPIQRDQGLYSFDEMEQTEQRGIGVLEKTWLCTMIRVTRLVSNGEVRCQ